MKTGIVLTYFILLINGKYISDLKFQACMLILAVSLLWHASLEKWRRDTPTSFVLLTIMTAMQK